MSEHQFSCRACSAKVEYAPGTRELECPYCGTRQEIAEAAAEAVVEAVTELDYHAALREAESGAATVEVLTRKCSSCGAESSVAQNVVADRCPFCGTPFVAQALSKKRLRPRALLPFKVGREEAHLAFRKWVASLWFAPSRLAAEAARGQISGLYLPFWTYDCKTTSKYLGQRGDDYTEQETYTAVENGRSVERTRSVTRTRWTAAAGKVEGTWDDVLVPASHSLPKGYSSVLEPWDLKALVPYEDRYLSGFKVESYGVALGDGFEEAKGVLGTRIEQLIRQDIGGDRQTITSVSTDWRDVTFKHVLLPLWISSYRFSGQPYRFIVNARTGEVHGERPWSWVKIALAVFAAFLVLLIVLGIMASN